jgi:hypothetical protein
VTADPRAHLLLALACTASCGRTAADAQERPIDSSSPVDVLSGDVVLGTGGTQSTADGGAADGGMGNFGGAVADASDDDASAGAAGASEWSPVAPYCAEPDPAIASEYCPRAQTLGFSNLAVNGSADARSVAPDTEVVITALLTNTDPVQGIDVSVCGGLIADHVDTEFIGHSAYSAGTSTEGYPFSLNDCWAPFGIQAGASYPCTWYLRFGSSMAGSVVRLALWAEPTSADCPAARQTFELTVQ